MIMYGKPVAEKIYKELVNKVMQLKSHNIVPSVGVILVGEDRASIKYVAMKEEVAHKLGIDFRLFHLPGNISQKKVEELVCELGKNKIMSGLMIQLPLPANFKTEKILKMIPKVKDIDGLTGEKPTATALAIMEIIKFYKINLKNKYIVVVGKGRLVGAPLEKLLKEKNYNVIACDKKTVDIKDKLLKADVIVTGVGVPGLITTDLVKQSAVIIDAGTKEVDGKLQGDVDPKVYEKVSAYSPSPGGVGPVTVACLMKNIVKAAEK